MKINNSLALVSTALIFAITMLYFSSSPIAEPSTKSIMQGWFGYLFCPIAAILFLCAAITGVMRSLSQRKHAIKLNTIHRFDFKRRKSLD